MYRGDQVLKDKIKDVIRALVDARSVAIDPCTEHAPEDHNYPTTKW